MRTITLEEHFMTADFLQATDALAKTAGPQAEVIRRKLLDFDDLRLASMDAAGIDVQVLSLAALGLDKLNAADEVTVLHGVHDELAAAIQRHPTRFRGFATPPLKDVPAAVREIHRCIGELGFVGVMIDGTTDGKFLDAPEFFPVLEAIASLDVPLYLHPAPPPREVAEVYYTGLPGELGHMLSIAGWGWHAETGLHMLRLIVSGVLDRLPTLRVIVGHMGEGVPYALARSSGILSPAANLSRTVADTLKQQFSITTSGYFTRPPFDCARTVFGFDHLMYSVDYPFSENSRGVELLNALDLTPDEMAAFRGGHAEALLRL